LADGGFLARQSWTVHKLVSINSSGRLANPDAAVFLAASELTLRKSEPFPPGFTPAVAGSSFSVFDKLSGAADLSAAGWAAASLASPINWKALLYQFPAL
jgi:hypothetical protein